MSNTPTGKNKVPVKKKSASKKKTVKKTGPKGPTKQDRIKLEEVDKLLRYFCTAEEIAAFFDVSPDTLTTFLKRKTGMNFSEYSAIKENCGKVSLRRMLFVRAKKSDSILLRLSEKYLGFKNEISHKVDLNTEANKEMKDEYLRLLDAGKEIQSGSRESDLTRVN